MRTHPRALRTVHTSAETFGRHTLILSLAISLKPCDETLVTNLQLELKKWLGFESVDA